MHNTKGLLRDIPMNGKSASQTPQTPETFKIEITYEPEFTNLIERVRNKYGEELLSLSGIGKSELDRSKFADKFFKTAVTADASIDPNSNLSDHSTISYSFESGKSFNKLNSLYLLWKSISKSDGIEEADAIIEKVLRGDLYIHDLHGVEAGKPYCVAGDTPVLTECGYMSIKDIYEDFEKGVKHSAVINDNFALDPIVQVHKKEDATLVQLRAKCGYNVNLTPDHKVLTCNSKKEDIKFKQADQIVKGDRVMLSFPEPAMHGDYKFINGIKLDENLAEMLAYFYSFGGFGKVRMDESTVYFNKYTQFMEDRIIGHVKRLLEELGEDPERTMKQDTRKKNYNMWFIDSDPFADFLRSAGVIEEKRRANNGLFIHDALMHSPMSVIRAFLRYLIGSIAKLYDEKPLTNFVNCVMYSCWSNDRFATQVGLLMLIAGTPANIFHNATGSLVKLPRDLARNFLEKVGLPDFDRVYHKELFDWADIPCTNYYAMRSIVEHDGVKYVTLPVRSVTQLEGKHTVYDIGTENSHMFLANGLVVHNCFNYSTYDVMAEGLPMVNKIKCVPPKHLFAFKSQVEQFTILASNSTLGATGLADMFITMSYYVKNILQTLKDDGFSFKSEEDVWAYVKSTITSMIYSLNQPMRASQCVNMSTKILTNHGFRLPEEIQPLDMAAVAREGTDELSWEPIRKINITKAPTEMQTWENTSTGANLTVTPAHRMYFRPDKTSPYGFVQSQDVYNTQGTELDSLTAPRNTAVKDVMSEVSLNEVIDSISGNGLTEKTFPLLAGLSENQAAYILSKFLNDDDMSIPAKDLMQAETLLFVSVMANQPFAILQDTDENSNNPYVLIRTKGTQDKKTISLIPSGIKPPETDTVWCPTVDSGNFVALENGNLFVTGNSPFTNVSLYDKYFLESLCEDIIFPDGSSPDSEIVNKIQEVYIDVMNEELDRTPITFPVTTACFSKDPETGELLDQDFVDFIAEKNLKYGFINMYCGESSTLSSCCRLRSSTKNKEFFNSFGAGQTKIGSLGVVTINLPRLGYLHRNDEDTTAFEEDLLELVKTTAKINNAKREIIQDRIDQGVQPLYSLGFMDIHRQYNTTGATGLYECMKFLGKDISSEEGIKYAQELMEKINKTIDEMQDFYKAPSNIEQVPAENCSITLCRKDKLLGYSDMDLEMYSNQFLPLTEPYDIIDRVIVQGQLDKHFSGGSVLHLNLEERIEDKEVLKDFINFCAKQGVVYFAINYCLNECEHGHISVGNTDTCPHCNAPIETKYTRVVGSV